MKFENDIFLKHQYSQYSLFIILIASSCVQINSFILVHTLMLDDAKIALCHCKTFLPVGCCPRSINFCTSVSNVYFHRDKRRTKTQRPFILTSTSYSTKRKLSLLSFYWTELRKAVGEVVRGSKNVGWISLIYSIIYYWFLSYYPIEWKLRYPFMQKWLNLQSILQNEILRTNLAATNRFCMVLT